MKNTEPIYDLLQINLDRVADYEKASVQTIIGEVNTFFSDMARQGRLFVNELQRLLRVEGDEPAEGTTQRGTIYNRWSDIKTNFNANGKEDLLEVCEKGEVAAKDSYAAALKKYKSGSNDIRFVIESQKNILERTFREIKNIRNKLSI